MQLHQLLRFVTLGTPILLFDIQGIEICKVSSKEYIHVDLYEYSILDIGTGFMDFHNKRYGLIITIQK
jgi:hypothetical protein